MTSGNASVEPRHGYVDIQFAASLCSERICNLLLIEKNLKYQPDGGICLNGEYLQGREL